MFLPDGSMNSNRDAQQSTRAYECHDVVSKKGLAEGHDRQATKPESQNHERTCFAVSLAGLCSGQVRSQRAHTIFAKIITDLTWCRFTVFELIKNCSDCNFTRR